METYSINKIKLPNGDIVNLVDETSGYVKSSGVTSIGLSNATNGGLSISNSPVTSSGTITVGHSNILTSAQATSGIYPITIDKNGHIASYGTKWSPEAPSVAYQGGTTTIQQDWDAKFGSEPDDVGEALDLIASGALTGLDVVSTYSSTGSDPVNGKAINAALQTLDSSVSATTGQAISALTITDGKITSSTKINVGEANQNAFSNIKVGTDTIVADSTTDTLEIAGGTGVLLTADTTNDKVTINIDTGALGGGTVTNVSVANSGGLTITGSPITSTGTISIGHANSSITAQTTQAVYPIKIDTYGHITSYGTAVTIPTVYNAALTFKKGTTTVKSFTANASTGVTVTFATGTVLSSASLTGSETAIDTTKFSGGSFTRGTFTGGSFTQGADSFTPNVPTTPTSVTYTVSGGTSSASPGTLILSVTAGVKGTAASFTQGTDSFTAATHANDSFTAAKLNTGFYTAGTLGLSTSTMTVLSNVS